MLSVPTSPRKPLHPWWRAGGRPATFFCVLRAYELVQPTAHAACTTSRFLQRDKPVTKNEEQFSFSFLINLRDFPGIFFFCVVQPKKKCFANWSLYGFCVACVCGTRVQKLGKKKNPWAPSGFEWLGRVAGHFINVIFVYRTICNTQGTNGDN